EPFITGGEDAAREWMQNEGRKNIEALNEVLQATATPVKF
ncbi:tagatose-bisphosphate aldolase, partial [Enterococcus saigonensis]